MENTIPCRLLLDAGCPVDLLAGDSQTPLQVACIHGQAKVFKELVKRGAAVNDRVKWAAVLGDHKECRALVREEMRCGRGRQAESN